MLSGGQNGNYGHTQMMESAINQPNPTRAEITDIAKCRLRRHLGRYAFGETAVGKYPAEAVRIMGKNCAAGGTGCLRNAGV